jgi:hypothetical protein
MFSARTTRHVDWRFLLTLIDGRKSLFEGFLPRAKEVVQDFLLIPSSQSTPFDEDDEVCHRAECSEIPRRTINVAKSSDRNSFESTPAPAVFSANPAPSNLTPEASHSGLPPHPALEAPVSPMQSSVEVDDGVSPNASLSPLDGFLDSGIPLREVDREVLQMPDWDTWFNQIV